ncbi:MAG: 2-oxo acid dehydrogenase subunit E2 [Gammaproteobacteria bacterium]|jgi:pyruvate dehydrogenase E2 component (dihydrolipoamide acetyltransferase)|nr:2-oxo acid dehydrogenase subunit E2 [Gammaproteobacteria bacterium]
MTTELQVKVPDIGDFDAVEIVEVMVAAGDEVAAEDSLITLETDKAAMDVPAPYAGKVVEVKVAVGDKVSEGSVILTLAADSDAAGAADADAAQPEQPAEAPAAAAPAAAAADQPTEQPAEQAAGAAAGPAVTDSKPVHAISEAGFAKAHASPSVRKLAREMGVDLRRVKGTGAKQRITADDVKGFVKSVMAGQSAGASSGTGLPPLPQVNFVKFGSVEEKPLGRIQKISGPRLHASWVNIPHVTQQDEADITELEQRRQALKGKATEQGVKLTPLAFIIRAVVLTLQEYRVFNTSMGADAATLIWKNYMHIGFAADTPNGLVVPVIRNADQKGVFEIAAELAELSAGARDGKLKSEQMQGSSFTVSSLGGIGGTFFTPIINPPEVAILGVGRSRHAPVWDGSAFQPRLMLPVSLSYDHRVIDGATGVRFTSFLGKALADPDKLLDF